MRRHPHLYEINALVFVRRLSEKYGRTVTLATVPGAEWQELKKRGFDLVWLMGVWQRSPGARHHALVNPYLRPEYDRVLPGWTSDDVTGSPYAIYGYTLDPMLGSREELAEVRARLNEAGIGLILDFVPNHLAFDHPWTLSHPDWFIAGRKVALRHHPDWFFQTGEGVHLAHGRDPNFGPWTDTVQVNFYSEEMRRALIAEILQVAAAADGVRCDMAMLALNEIFEQIWAWFLPDSSPIEEEFWTEAIGQVKQTYPGFLFLAEVYWGCEGQLHRLGFDFTYDKTLYDRLRAASPDSIRRHLATDSRYHERAVHFVENHDEPRAVTAFGRERSMAAAIVTGTIPGARLFHDGQTEGCQIRLPVQLGRELEETQDPEIRQFYNRLLAVCDAPAYHDGRWQLIEVAPAWAGNESHRNLLSWAWRHRSVLKLVVINYSAAQAQGWLRLQLPRRAGKSPTFRDETNGEDYVRDRDELRGKGLYVDLGPWQAHLFSVALD